MESEPTNNTDSGQPVDGGNYVEMDDDYLSTSTKNSTHKQQCPTASSSGGIIIPGMMTIGAATTSQSPPTPTVPSLTVNEILKLQELLRQYDDPPNKNNNNNSNNNNNDDDNDVSVLKPNKSTGSDYPEFEESTTVCSDYPEFEESTTAWAIFADDPNIRGTGEMERLVGCIMIFFQLFAYWLFAAEAIEDYQFGKVPVFVNHRVCVESGEMPGGNDGDYLQCEGQFTNTLDAFVAYTMLAIFLCKDCLQAVRVIRVSPMFTPSQFFACLAGIEVISCFFSASIAVSYNLFIGEVTDAIEVGVGLLFIRELSRRAYSAIRHRHGRGHRKEHRNFFVCLIILLSIAMIMDPIYAKLFAGYIQ